MYKFLNPWVNLASAQILALSRFALDPAAAPAERLASLWRDARRDQAQFVTEWTDNCLQFLARQRQLNDGQFNRISQETERVAVELARTTARAVGIATQARRSRRDRRIFSLPLPEDRRAAAPGDRRIRPALARSGLTQPAA